MSESSGIQIVALPAYTMTFRVFPSLPPDGYQLRLASFIGLLSVGYDRIMFSHGSIQCWRGRDTGLLNDLNASSPNRNITHISRNILPIMREAGVREEEINTLMVNNPCCYFKK